METSSTQEADIQEMMKAYLEAFEARDLERCMEYFDPEATLDWQIGVYQGASSIEQWHKDRFGADLKITQVEGIQVTGQRVAMNLVVTSKRLKAWRLKRLKGHVDVEVEDGKIKKMKFSAKTINPQQNWT